MSTSCDIILTEHKTPLLTLWRFEVLLIICGVYVWFFGSPVKLPLWAFENQYWTTFIMILKLSLLIAFACTMARMAEMTFVDMGFCWTKANKQLFWLCFGIYCILILELVGFSQAIVLRGLKPGMVDFSRQFDFFTITRALISSPILEEIIFRGILFTLITKLSNWKWGLGVSSLLFWGAHFIYGNASFFQLPMGLCLGFVFKETRSLFWPMILHALANLLGSVYPFMKQIVF